MPMPKHKRFNEKDISDYEPSDSDDDYNENEKILLGKVRNRKSEVTDSEEEILGVNVSDEESDESDLALSDIEGQQDDDDLPDSRAWGKDKRKFYSTDYVDQDYGGYQGKDAQLAELEEEEARNLQQQLAQQLDDDDFDIDFFPIKKSGPDQKQFDEVIKTDISKLSKRQKIEILKKESPEFFSLIEDFKTKMSLTQDYLNPILRKYKKGQIPNCGATEFVETHYDLILNYCTNIYMYFLLKASRVNLANHPVIKRLYQYSKLLAQLNDVFEEIIKPQIEYLLQDLPAEEVKVSKKLVVLEKLINTSEKKKKNLSNHEEEKPTLKKVKFNSEDKAKLIDSEKDQQDPHDGIQDNTTEIDENGKRAITYQISKNKGLTPYRKKENRNPRVKHRNKFKKAKIRRKGAVRKPRTEMARYSGEISGIKATVTKSIKIKT